MHRVVAAERIEVQLAEQNTEEKALWPAAEKAAAEEAEEKAAEEKAVVEKAMAKKAMAEKAMAEKAMAEKAAAEKAAVEAAEQEKMRVLLIQLLQQGESSEAEVMQLLESHSKRAEEKDNVSGRGTRPLVLTKR